MRERIRLAAVTPGLIVAVVLGFASAACIDLGGDSAPREQQPVPAGPPTPCTASASPTPFCTSAAGACPLLADDTIACPSGSVATEGFSSTGGLGLASAPGNRGDMVLGAASGVYEEDQQLYVELGAFDPTGAATFTIDTFPPFAGDDTEGQSDASLSVVANAQGAPILLSTIGGGLSAAVGSAASGGTFTVEQAVPAPADGYGWVMDGAVVEMGGAVDVLLQTSQTTEIAHRDTTGAWSQRSLPALGFGSAVMAVDATGVVYVAGWAPASAAGMEQLEIIVGSNAPVVVTSLAEADVTQVELTVGQNSDGSALPVAAFGSAFTLAVPDGKGGFTTFQPTLTVAQAYQDGCGSSLSLGNCSCPQTCSRTGDNAGWIQLVRDAQGDVYVAWLEVNTDMTYPVTLNSTSVGSQMITCSCDPDTQNGTGSTTGLGLQLERLVMSPSPSTEHRGTIPVPSDTTGSIQAVDGNGTIQLLLPASSSTGTAGALRRVVLDASKLP